MLSFMLSSWRHDRAGSQSRQGLGDVFGAAGVDHGFVRQIIMLPNFGQGAA
jgi:hypothetical protein